MLNDIQAWLDKPLFWVGAIGTLISFAGAIAFFIAWLRGIVPVAYRLGIGLTKKKIAIFAQGDEANSLASLLENTKLFPKPLFGKDENVKLICIEEDWGDAQNCNLFLIHRNIGDDQIVKLIGRFENNRRIFIVYAPPSLPRLSDEVTNAINRQKYASIANHRGRLLNDIVTSMITSGWEK